MISRCKTCRYLVLIPAPRAMPIIYPILSILNQKQPREMEKGKHDLFLSTCVPASCAVWCCVLLSGPAVVQSSRTVLVVTEKRMSVPNPFPPTPLLYQVAFPLSNNPCAGGVTVPVELVPCRCGEGVDVYKKMLVHPFGRCFSPHQGFTCLGFWNKWVG